MAVLTVQQIVPAGITPAFVTPTVTTGDVFANDGRVYVEVKNGNASPITVTVKAVGPCSQGVLHDLPPVTVPATTGDVKIGPFEMGRYNDANKNANVICSAITTVTIAAFRL